MWIYSSKDDYQNITLHDCYIEKIFTENKDIIFEFDNEGFWIVDSNRHNPFGKTVRTDKSQIRFLNFDSEFNTIYIFKRVRIFRKTLFWKRIEISLSEFSSKINNGEWKFEVVDELYNYRRSIYNGYVYFRKRSRYYECQIELYFDEMIYSWNKLRENRTW